ncbi:MAG: co-chaperone GroES [Anaerolineae bacterium]|nr:co-chaperone GroES [Anaerolineae bacterium]MEB2286666.1 co-chaperone GroES [Anaerolineae bacterium]
MAKKINIEPLGARVLVLPLEGESQSPGGVLLPETAKEKPQQGTIEAIGDPDEMETNLKVGDRVLFPKYTGTEIKFEGKTYLLMNEDDVLARIQ